LRKAALFNESDEQRGRRRFGSAPLLLRSASRHLLIELLLQGSEIEACALLHGREIEEGLRLLPVSC